MSITALSNVSGKNFRGDTGAVSHVDLGVGLGLEAFCCKFSPCSTQSLAFTLSVFSSRFLWRALSLVISAFSGTLSFGCAASKGVNGRHRLVTAAVSSAYRCQNSIVPEILNMGVYVRGLPPSPSSPSPSLYLYLSPSLPASFLSALLPVCFSFFPSIR